MRARRTATGRAVIAAVAIVVVLVGLVGAIGLGSLRPPASSSQLPPGTNSSTVSTSATGFQTTLSSSPASLSTVTMFTTTCIRLDSEPLFLIVKNSSTGSPINSVPVQVRESTPNDLCSAASGNTSKSLGILSTNINGTIQVCCTGSTFFFNVTYMAESYQVASTAQGAESAQCVILYIPSGTTSTSFSPTFQNHC